MGTWGVGMPAELLLAQFGKVLHDYFGEYAYQVGSSLHTRDWHDVDVRIILDDYTYAFSGFGDPKNPQMNTRWISIVMAFSALGKQMTGLPIDFQVQQQTYANTKYKGPRSALIVPEHFINC